MPNLRALLAGGAVMPCHGLAEHRLEHCVCGEIFHNVTKAKRHPKRSDIRADLSLVQKTG